MFCILNIQDNAYILFEVKFNDTTTQTVLPLVYLIRFGEVGNLTWVRAIATWLMMHARLDEIFQTTFPLLLISGE